MRELRLPLRLCCGSIFALTLVGSGALPASRSLAMEPLPHVTEQANNLAATNLNATQQCLEQRGHIATLTWVPAAVLGSGQQVQVTIYPNGFDRGLFETSLTLPPTQTAFVWADIQPGVIYQWRVLTLQPSGPVLSAITTFQGLQTCVADEGEEPRSPE